MLFIILAWTGRNLNVSPYSFSFAFLVEGYLCFSRWPLAVIGRDLWRTIPWETYNSSLNGWGDLRRRCNSASKTPAVCWGRLSFNWVIFSSVSVGNSWTRFNKSLSKSAVASASDTALWGWSCSICNELVKSRKRKLFAVGRRIWLRVTVSIAGIDNEGYPARSNSAFRKGKSKLTLWATKVVSANKL